MWDFVYFCIRQCRGCAFWRMGLGYTLYILQAMTVIYPSPVFGPVKSRRLGVSLGINLMPGDGKVCSFDCIYCECGLNAERRTRSRVPAREEVREALERKLREMSEGGTLPDVLTFAGNGEPTGHPQFAGIIGDTIELRDRYCPSARVSVLSNATNLHREDVVAALRRVDNNIQKLDTVSAEFIRLVDRPVRADYDVRRVVEQLRGFEGHVTVQTMFLCGEDAEGRTVDNTGEEYVGEWLEALRHIGPEKVMVYTIDRETPVVSLRKAPRERLDGIAARVRAAGMEVSVSY